MLFLDESLLLRSEQSPDDIAITDTEITYSFKQFDERVNRIAAGLQVLGLKPRDRLSILADNSADYLATHYACARTGVILHVLNVSLTPSEMAYAVNDAGSQTLFVDSAYTGEGLHQLLTKTPLLKQVIALAEPCEDCHQTLEEVLSIADAPQKVSRAATDPVLLIYTSGTTGRPKGALQNHLGSMMADKLTGTAGEFSRNDVWLASMPFFHQAGLIRSRAIINAGGRNIILGRLSPAQLASAIAKHRITVAMPMGRQLATLLSAMPLPTSLRLLIGGGGIGAEAMSAIDKACAQLGCSWIGVYGQTETHGTITVVDLETAKANPLTCGYPGKGVRLDIVDDRGASLPPDTTGEILVYGDMTGHYWNNDEANTALYTSDGGLRTGDLGYLNVEGWLHLRGRKKELIKTGGENVYPQEVERVLLEHPCVQDAAAIGLPDEDWGEAVVAIIVASGETRPSLEDFREFCRGELAGYKLPRRLCWVEELPRNHTGKVQTGLLRSRFSS